jgi:hypothetical protein
MTVDADGVMREDDDVTEVVTASGYLLTQRDIEALADEAERGYDLTRAKRVVMGKSSRAQASHRAAGVDEDSQR